MPQNIMSRRQALLISGVAIPALPVTAAQAAATQSTLMQDLYDSEINVSVSTFWDGGFDVKLGDELSGFGAETQVRTWADAEEWLMRKAVAAYPESEFAAKYRRRVS